MANASPEPFSNWALSLGEDIFVLGLGYLALKHPIAALVVAIAALVAVLISSSASSFGRSNGGSDGRRR